MKKISVLDTSICSTNLGDQIIMEAVINHIKDIFKNPFIVRIPTHEIISKWSYKLLQDSDYIFTGGTNLLTSNALLFRQWRIGLKDALFLKNLILMGVGWCNYQYKPDWYTRCIYKSIFDKEHMHSVRDNYTKAQLSKICLNNVVNTGCPTLWVLDEKLCNSIPYEKSENVLCCLTSYNQNIKLDTELLNLLKKEYKKVYFWVQNIKDYSYSRNISSGLEYVDPNLDALNDLLKSSINFDYVGTRLHAGIRAMQYKRRSIILAIDNRAREMGKDYNINVVERDDFMGIRSKINSEFHTKINLDLDAIDKWKKQFNIYSLDTQDEIERKGIIKSVIKKFIIKNFISNSSN